MRNDSKIRNASLIQRNLRLARAKWGHNLSPAGKRVLRDYSALHMSVERGDLLLIDGKWYVTHSGLLGLASRRRCCGIDVAAMPELCDTSASRWAFRAKVYKSSTCKGFVGHGDADPSNVSALVRGAEMRVAETRAVNRALRKAYGIGICSVEEIGCFAIPVERSAVEHSANVRKLPPQPANGNGNGQPKLRDRLCLLIRQHQLDASLVKRYAMDFCRVTDLRQAGREQIETFNHLAELASKDRNELISKLNGYAQKAGAA